MPTVLAVSPHLDDVAFSCGGVLVALARAGWTTRVVTVFSATVLPLSPFALACQLDKGLDASVDYMALRRDEDAAAMRCLDVGDWRHLGLPEAPHRDYASAPDLFAGVHSDDDIAAQVREVLAPELDGADLVLGPQGLGNHVDHLLVAAALDELTGPGERDVPLLCYRDTPYAARLFTTGRKPDELAVDISTALPAKLDACAAYASQLGFQFGGVALMREALRAFAEAEAARCGSAGPAEVFAGGPAARERAASWLDAPITIR